jgi:hypothetical protein
MEKRSDQTPIEGIGMILHFEPNPHRGWTSDDINRMMHEKIQSGEIDPKVMKIKHTESFENKIKKCHDLLREMGL